MRTAAQAADHSPVLVIRAGLDDPGLPSSPGPKVVRPSPPAGAPLTQLEIPRSGAQTSRLAAPTAASGRSVDASSSRLNSSQRDSGPQMSSYVSRTLRHGRVSVDELRLVVPQLALGRSQRAGVTDELAVPRCPFGHPAPRIDPTAAAAALQTWNSGERGGEGEHRFIMTPTAMAEKPPDEALLEQSMHPAAGGSFRCGGGRGLLASAKSRTGGWGLVARLASAVSRVPLPWPRPPSPTPSC
jgi:hypothetical protein